MLHGYLPSLLQGALVTLSVAFASITIACILGMIGASAKLSRSKVLRAIAAAYTTMIRGVPDLVLMLLVFYGGQVAINALALKLGYEEYIDINPYLAGVLTIGFIYGAYLTETFRGAIMAIPPGQREAGLAYGMSPLRVLLKIIVPQMVRLALPAFSNNWLVLLKATAIVSVIGLNDLMFKAGLAAGATREPFVFYVAVGALYLALTTVSIIFFRWLDQRLSKGVKVVRT